MHPQRILDTQLRTYICFSFVLCIYLSFTIFGLIIVPKCFTNGLTCIVTVVYALPCSDVETGIQYSLVLRDNTSISLYSTPCTTTNYSEPKSWKCKRCGDELVVGDQIATTSLFVYLLFVGIFFTILCAWCIGSTMVFGWRLARQIPDDGFEL
jgi:hypothetical protein